MNRRRLAWLAGGPALAAMLVVTAAIAASPNNRPLIGGPALATPRPGPAYTMPKKPPPMTMPRAAPAIVPRTDPLNSNCRAMCASRCQSIQCPGLNVSQCISVRQRCRMGCTTGC